MGRKITESKWKENEGARDTIFVYNSGIERYVDQNDTLCLIVWTMCESSVALSANPSISKQSFLFGIQFIVLRSCHSKRHARHSYSLMRPYHKEVIVTWTSSTELKLAISVPLQWLYRLVGFPLLIRDFFLGIC